MTRRIQWLSAGAALVIGAAGAAAALAQPVSPPAPLPPAGEGRHEVIIQRDGSEMRMENDGRVMIMRRAVRHQDKAAHLRAVLQLRPNQEPALTAYLQAIDAPREMIHVIRSDDAPKTTPQRLADTEKMLAEHDAAVHGRIEATRRFYDQLDAAQKKAFDELDLADDHMALLHLASFHPPMPPMPPMRVPAPPTPPSF